MDVHDERAERAGGGGSGALHHRDHAGGDGTGRTVLQHDSAGRNRRPPGRVFNALRAAFLAELRPFIRIPALSLAAAAACFIAAFILYRAVGTDYLPALDEGAFTLDYFTPAPSTLGDTDALLG